MRGEGNDVCALGWRVGLCEQLLSALEIENPVVDRREHRENALLGPNIVAEHIDGLVAWPQCEVRVFTVRPQEQEARGALERSWSGARGPACPADAPRSAATDRSSTRPVSAGRR